MLSLIDRLGSSKEKEEIVANRLNSLYKLIREALILEGLDPIKVDSYIEEVGGEALDYMLDSIVKIAKEDYKDYLETL